MLFCTTYNSTPRYCTIKSSNCLSEPSVCTNHPLFYSMMHMMIVVLGGLQLHKRIVEPTFTGILGAWAVELVKVDLPYFPSSTTSASSNWWWVLPRELQWESTLDMWQSMFSRVQSGMSRRACPSDSMRFWILYSPRVWYLITLYTILMRSTKSVYDWWKSMRLRNAQPGFRTQNTEFKS